MDKGFVIMAQGDDYVKCAKVLEKSIKNVMPDSNVTIAVSYTHLTLPTKRIV